MAYRRGSNQPPQSDAVHNPFDSCVYTPFTPSPETSPLCPLPSIPRLPSCVTGSLRPPRACNLIHYSDIPRKPSTDADRYLPERFETARTYLPPWIADLSWCEEIHPESVDHRVDFPFEDIDTNVPREGKSVFAGSISPNQPSNTATSENSLAPPITTGIGPIPSTASTTPLQSQALPAPPAHKYQCTACLKTFDRKSRLENCINRHFGVKPHRCFGVCGSTGCPVSYASIEQLNRHVTRLVLCTFCGKPRSKQNMARHRASCRGKQ